MGGKLASGLVLSKSTTGASLALSEGVAMAVAITVAAAAVVVVVVVVVFVVVTKLPPARALEGAAAAQGHNHTSPIASAPNQPHPPLYRGATGTWQLRTAHPSCTPHQHQTQRNDAETPSVVSGRRRGATTVSRCACGRGLALSGASAAHQHLDSHVPNSLRGKSTRELHGYLHVYLHVYLHGYLHGYLHAPGLV